MHNETNPALAALRRHVSGAVERGTAEPITELAPVSEQTPEGPRVYRLGDSTSAGTLPASMPLRRTPAGSASEPQP